MKSIAVYADIEKIYGLRSYGLEWRGVTVLFDSSMSHPDSRSIKYLVASSCVTFQNISSFRVCRSWDLWNIFFNLWSGYVRVCVCVCVCVLPSSVFLSSSASHSLVAGCGDTSFRRRSSDHFPWLSFSLAACSLRSWNCLSNLALREFANLLLVKYPCALPLYSWANPLFCLVRNTALNSLWMWLLDSGLWNF